MLSSAPSSEWAPIHSRDDALVAVSKLTVALALVSLLLGGLIAAVELRDGATPAAGLVVAVAMGFATLGFRWLALRRLRSVENVEFSEFGLRQVFGPNDVVFLEWRAVDRIAFSGGLTWLSAGKNRIGLLLPAIPKTSAAIDRLQPLLLRHDAT